MAISHSCDYPGGLWKGNRLASLQTEINPGDVIKVQLDPAPPLGAYSLELRAPEFASADRLPSVDLAGYEAIVTLPGIRPVSSLALGPAAWQPPAVKEIRWSSPIAPTMALDFTLILHLDFNQRELLQVYHGDAIRPGPREDADLFHGVWLDLSWWAVLREIPDGFTVPLPK